LEEFLKAFFGFQPQKNKNKERLALYYDTVKPSFLNKFFRLFSRTEALFGCGPLAALCVYKERKKPPRQLFLILSYYPG